MYAQPQDIIDRFGAREVQQVLEADQKGTPDPQNARLLAACADAAALADTYIARAHPLPLPSVPVALVSVTADIARYRLHDDQIKEGGDTGKTTIRLRYEDALQWLSDVAAGKVQLFPGDNDQRKPDSPLPLTGNHRIAVVSSPVVFDQATLDKMDMVRKG